MQCAATPGAWGPQRTPNPESVRAHPVLKPGARRFITFISSLARYRGVDRKGVQAGMGCRQVWGCRQLWGAGSYGVQTGMGVQAAMGCRQLWGAGSYGSIGSYGVQAAMGCRQLSGAGKKVPFVPGGVCCFNKRC